MISASPSLAQSDKAGSLANDSSGDAVKSVARPAPADGAMPVAPPTASLGEAVDAVALTPPADGAMHVAPPIASSGEAVGAVPSPIHAHEAAQTEPPTMAPSDEALRGSGPVRVMCAMERKNQLF
jgi:hypothetical protein